MRPSCEGDPKMERSYVSWFVRTVAIGTSALAGVVLSLACTRMVGATEAGAAAIGVDEADAGTPACSGDCNGDGRITVDEIITLVNIALGDAQASSCARGIANVAQVGIALIVEAIGNALNGCAPT